MGFCGLKKKKKKKPFEGYLLFEVSNETSEPNEIAILMKYFEKKMEREKPLLLFFLQYLSTFLE